MLELACLLFTNSLMWKMEVSVIYNPSPIDASRNYFRELDRLYNYCSVVNLINVLLYNF